MLSYNSTLFKSYIQYYLETIYNIIFKLYTTFDQQGFAKAKA